MRPLWRACRYQHRSLSLHRANTHPRHRALLLQSTGIKGGVPGAIKVEKETVNLTTKTERVIAEADGTTKMVGVGTIHAVRKGESMTEGAAVKVVESVIGPVPTGTMAQKGMEYLNQHFESTQNNSTCNKKDGSCL